VPSMAVSLQLRDITEFASADNYTPPTASVNTGVWFLTPLTKGVYVTLYPSAWFLAPNASVGRDQPWSEFMQDGHSATR